ncbi:putative bifunctional diguanylate cyclase/phosphodiesterase [Paenibacillus aestuarii]|uniref:Bifunctional diguanylate cyclase/phosphodiesterase n=1 Tax=Paenibacillus aestuarii TaxID=516965 RepID=A0ABW0K3X7_9BACL|nr:EAL domain-containing protein [Paenibacillus aestuarii]
MRTLHLILIAVIVTAIVSSVEAVLGNYENALLHERKLSEESQLSSRALALKSVIDRNFNLMASLEAYVNSDFLKGKSDIEVLNYMSSLYTGIQGSALNVLIAPGGIVKYVYPLEGNESIMNRDLLHDPRGNVQAQVARALNSKGMTIDGPFRLIQGKDGVVARKAFYHDGEFWGLISVGLDVQQLMVDAGVKGKDNGALQVAIRKPGEPAFYGDDRIFQMKPMFATITFSDNVWELAALPQQSALQHVSQQIRFIRSSYISVLVLGLLFYLYIVRQRIQLSRIVRERTQELLLANEELTAMNEELTVGEQELQESTRRLQVSEQKLTYMAYHDMLTGIYNRTHFQTRLQEQMELQQERGGLLAVLFFDLDNFKIVNDSHGHHIGDLLLQQVVNRIQQAELPYHTFARFGGDEFVMLFTAFDHVQDIRQVCERLLDLFKAPCLIANRSFFINLSIGIAEYPHGGTTAQCILKNADIAMYIAKKESSGSYIFFNRQMESNTLSKLEMGNHLRQAMTRNELEIVYQPQVDCEQGRIVGVEALLRWKHPTKGYISPAEFIPLAEEMGLIIPIGEWVLRSACAQMEAWHKQMGISVALSVNLSVRQLHDERLVDKVRLILEETGLEPRFLEMEITENVAMKDEQLDVLRELRSLGIAISVDDFGTKYSSLSYLKRFPVTKIKLDQSFVRGVHTDAKDRAMVKAIISVANYFQLNIIAEGVETEEQASFLVENGCKQIQGYYFYRPMFAEDMLLVLRQSLRSKLAFMEVAAAEGQA